MKLKKYYIIFLVIGSIITSCQKDLYNFTKEFSVPEVSKEPPVITYLVDKGNRTVEIANLKKVADYTKIPFEEMSLSLFNEKKTLKTSTRVVCITKSDPLSNAAIDSLLSFVAKGGTVFFSKASTDKRINYLLGLTPETLLSRDEGAMGYFFNKPVFPGNANFKFEKKGFYHLGIPGRNFSNNVQILATAFNDRTYPLITENTIGKGKVVYFNSTISFTKEIRGLMFAHVLMGLEGIPYPVANTSTVFLDDFPSPIYNINKEPIKTELGISVSDFVTNVWWPDMKKFGQEENLKYSAYVTFDYNSFIVPPFTFKEWDKNTFTKNSTVQEKSSWLGRDIIENGHELAFHGYNHVSLTKDNWKQPEYIVSSLNSAVKKWNILDFKRLPISYVPPANIIDSVGLAKLQEAIPSIKYIQSTYLGAKEDGGDREFDPEPYNDHFFNYPRISSGFYIEPVSEFTIESMHLYTGIWTHFVHPDDVYQIKDGSNKASSGDYEYRNKHNLNWYSKGSKTGLLDSFKNYLKDFKKKHPMSRFLTAEDASEKVLYWRYSYFSHSRIDGRYIVESDADLRGKSDHYWFMYVSQENEKIIANDLNNQGVVVQKTPFLQGNLYTIKTGITYLSIPDMEFYGHKARLNPEAEKTKVFENYNAYLVEGEALRPLALKVQEAIANNDLKKATDLIITYINNNKGLITNKLWQDLATYLVWQEKGSAIWPIYEDFFIKNQNKNNADLSREIAAIAGYENDLSRDKWLVRQLDLDTTDEEVITEYLAYFNKDINKHTVLRAYKKLISINPSVKNNKAYIESLLHFNAKEIVPVLKNISPCDEDYKDMALTIAWAFADKFHFDDAIEWQKCASGIDKETVTNWISKSSSFEDYKEKDFPFYMSILLAIDSKKAVISLYNVNYCDPSLVHLAKEIAEAYANEKLYIEALSWAECAKNLPVTQKLSWLYELKKYEKLKSVYELYIIDNPKDYEVKIYMATLHLYSNEVIESAKIVYELPIDIDNSVLRALLNKEVINLNVENQIVILDNYSAILFPEVRQEITKKIRQEEGNSIAFNTLIINDKLVPTTFANLITYKFFDKERNIHSVSATQSIMYPINSFPEDSINTEHRLLGLEYGFKNRAEKKYRYFGKTRIERDNFNKLFFQFGSGLSYSGDKSFNSYQLDLFPVRSGAGHSLNLYRTELNSYHELFLSKKVKQIIAVQGNYYTDNQVEIVALGRLEYILYNENNFTVSPLAEVSYGIASEDRRSGYPYWIANNRLYGGGGFSFKLGSAKSKLNMNLDAAIFIENDDTNFERYIYNASYRIKDFTIIKAGFEIYTIDNFYSNVFQLGLAYDFK